MGEARSFTKARRPTRRHHGRNQVRQRARFRVNGSTESTAEAPSCSEYPFRKVGDRKPPTGGEPHGTTVVLQLLVMRFGPLKDCQIAKKLHSESHADLVGHRPSGASKHRMFVHEELCGDSSRSTSQKSEEWRFRLAAELNNGHRALGTKKSGAKGPMACMDPPGL